MTKFNHEHTFGVVCHDAGGANQIAAMLKKFGWEPDWVVAEGPAATIWGKEFPSVSTERSFDWVKDATAVITGSGWSSNLEFDARTVAQKAGCLSITVLDHWVNYAARFVRDNLRILPDEVWVVDEDARAIAQEVFPRMDIVLMPDCYAEQQLSELAPVTATTPNNFLYLLEPLRSDWGRGEPGEFQALRYFLERIGNLDLPDRVEVQLRTHPSEARDKYSAFTSDSGPISVTMAAGTLPQNLSNSRWVAGCHTYALTIALRAGRTVYGSLPPWAPSCVLPHKNIIHLSKNV